MNARDYYFRMMERCIFNAKYVYAQFLKRHQRKQLIEILTAVVSGLSLATWLLQNEYAFACSVIIVASQTFSAVVPHLEISKHESALKQATLGCQKVKRQAESGWAYINLKAPSDEEITKMSETLQMEMAIVLDMALTEGINRDDKIGRTVSQETDAYIAKMYLGDN